MDSLPPYHLEKVHSNISIVEGMSVSLPCYASISRRASAVDLDILWKKGEKKVYQHYNNIITYGPGFENRVSLSPELALLGNNSLTVNKTQFSDEGEYQCFFNTPKENGHPDSVSLTVTVPSHISIVEGMSISLPCYGNIGRGASAVDLDILWKKSEKLVYQLYNNIITYGPGFENRASLSPELALLGNNSLTINQTQFSDEGEYQCFFNSPKENGYPDSVSLTVTVPVSKPNASVAHNEYPCTILCTVERGTGVTLSWYREGEERPFVTSPVHSAPHLDMTQAVDKGGIYTCEVKNAVNNATSAPITVGGHCKGSNTGMIVGIVGFLLFLFIVAVLLWRKKKCVPLSETLRDQHHRSRGEVEVDVEEEEEEVVLACHPPC
ncbi:hypothetical protein SKAU_G00345000 [Synaphobranchus kaupii]|uniref:Ig-like domain-containing protein n=1 Tax=Synaphobranchus kaupii TaxID=118154 RepID=A0A9Q1EJC8_SYNKA|nr:hypothetical protein SKAU_G00345000 [Synaphobranchus kaupii]